MGENVFYIKRKEETTKHLISMLMRTANTSRRSGAQSAYRKMIDFARQDRNMGDKLRTSLDMMCLRIEKARKNDLQKVFGTFALNRNEEKNKEIAQEKTIKRLFALMGNKGDRLLSEAYQKLLRNRIEIEDHEQRKLDSIKRMLTHANKNSLMMLLRGYKSLKDHSAELDEEESRRQKLLNLLCNGLVRAAKYKTTEALDTLRARMMSEKLQAKDQSIALRMIM